MARSGCLSEGSVGGPPRPPSSATSTRRRLLRARLGLGLPGCNACGWSGAHTGSGGAVRPAEQGNRHPRLGNEGVTVVQWARLDLGNLLCPRLPPAPHSRCPQAQPHLPSPQATPQGLRAALKTVQGVSTGAGAPKPREGQVSWGHWTGAGGPICCPPRALPTPHGSQLHSPTLPLMGKDTDTESLLGVKWGAG